MALSEQEILRRQKRQDLMAMGIDPYPAELFEVNVTAADIEKITNGLRTAIIRLTTKMYQLQGV